MLALKPSPSPVPGLCAPHCDRLFSTGFSGKERLRRMRRAEDQAGEVGGPRCPLPGPTSPKYPHGPCLRPSAL